MTNAKGKTSKYYYKDGRLDEIDRQKTNSCPNASSKYYYSGESEKIQYEDDWEGHRTIYSYNDKGQKRFEYRNGVTKEYQWDKYDRLSSLTIWDGAKKPVRKHCRQRDNCSVSVNFVKKKSYYYYGRGGNHRLKRIVESDISGAREVNFNYIFYSNNIVKRLKLDGPRKNVSDITTYLYNSSGQIKSITTPSGMTTSYRYADRYNEPRGVTGPNGLVVRYSYDGRGRVVKAEKMTSPKRVTKIYYDGLGNITKKETPTASVRYVYDDAGRLVREAYPGMLESTPYTPTDDEWEAIEEGAMGWFIKYTYDDLNNPIKVQQFYKTLNIPDEWGAGVGPSAEVHPGPVLLRREYDVNGLLKKKVGSNGQRWVYKYDKNQNVKTVTDALGRSYSFQYDESNRVATKERPEGSVTSYRYNPVGKIKRITDPNGNPTIYNRLGQFEMNRISPDTGVTQYSFDGHGNLSTKIDAKGVMSVYEYDSQNRIESIKAGSGASSVNIDYYYDEAGNCGYGKGRLCRVYDDTGFTQYRYNKDGTISRKSIEIEGHLEYFGYQYDDKGRLSEKRYPGGYRVRYDYNSLGQVSGLEVRINGNWKSVVKRKASNQFDKKVWRFGNGLSTVFRYDSDSRLTRLSTSGVQDLEYSYNKSNEIVEIENGIKPYLTREYTYTEESRVRYEITDGNNYMVWGYDSNGNKKEVSTDRGYEYENGSNRLDQINMKYRPFDRQYVRYSYDPNGNRIKEKEYHSGQSSYVTKANYTYNARNQLIRLNRRNVPYPVSYKYNFKKQKSYYQFYITTKRYYYDETDRLSVETGSDGISIESIYLYFEGQVVALIRNDRLYYVHNDHLGRPDLVTNNNGSVVWDADNKAYKREVLYSSIGNFNIGYPGQYYEVGTGLWYNWNRHYDSKIGRYLQSDPIGLKGGLNTYAYVDGNPVNSIDPRGLETKRCARQLKLFGSESMSPSGNPIRHDYLVVDGQVFSFQSGSNMVWSKGWIDNNEDTDNQKCELISEDPAFDEAVIEAVDDIGAPAYSVVAYPTTIQYLAGARNCQTWIDDVLDLAKGKYKNNSIIQ